MKTKTLDELRAEFEDMASFCMFDIKRLPNGEYQNNGRSTFVLWGGYFQCAKINGIITGEDAEIKNMNKL
jgi:hypothetical protein